MRHPPNQPNQPTGPTYRVRVVLDAERVDVRSFRASSLELRLTGLAGQINDVNGRARSGQASATGSVRLFGPWTDTGVVVGPTSGALDNATLTGMFESHKRALPIEARSVLLVYDHGANNGRQKPPTNPVQSVHLDYLSTTNADIRARYSRSFVADQLTVRLKHLDRLEEL